MEYKKTADEIQNEMLSNIDNSYEKSKGYFLWDILKAIAINLKAVWNSVQEVSEKLDVEKLSGNELERFVYQRTGIQRKLATYAEGVLTLTGNGTVKEGDLFETEGLIRFIATETVKIVDEGSVNIKAIFQGISGNLPSGTITKMPVTIPDISGCINKGATTKGYESESDIDLLNRYYEKLRIPATSGNIYHYQHWALEVAGVGAAKVFPLWNGNNTVKIIIIDQNRQPATEELVNAVQYYIDPGRAGIGAGEAPIGAFCTVESAAKKAINISVKLTTVSGYEVSVIKENMERKIAYYLESIAFKFNYLSYARVGGCILDVEGVLDYENLAINSGIGQNVICEDNEVMVLGSVIFIE